MSRSRKKGKSPGYEYWSARPGKSREPGRYAKTLTHRAERREIKYATDKQVKEASDWVIRNYSDVFRKLAELDKK